MHADQHPTPSDLAFTALDCTCGLSWRRPSQPKANDCNAAVLAANPET